MKIYTMILFISSQMHFACNIKKIFKNMYSSSKTSQVTYPEFMEINRFTC